VSADHPGRSGEFHAADGAQPGDLNTLRTALAVAERRAATLAELVSLMSEGRDALALAHRSVELTARATRAAGAFVYLWDRDHERLVLRVATEGWQRAHLDRISLRLGEGVTGWSALMRQTVVVPADPWKDPRFKTFPELRETSFKSMVAVPIVAPGEDVLGVFSLYGLTERVFSDDDVNLASEVGALLASGLLQAETLGRLRVQSAAARFLSDLPEGAWISLGACLDTMAAQCVHHLEADACLLEVTADRAQPHGGTSVLATSAGFRERHDPANGDWDRADILQALGPDGHHRIRIPLGIDVPLGALTCWRSRRFTPDDQMLTEAIGAQVAAGVLSVLGAEHVSPMLHQLTSAPDSAATDGVLRRHGFEPRPVWACLIRLLPAAPAPGRGDEQLDGLLAELLPATDNDDTCPALIVSGADGRHLLLFDQTDPATRQRFVDRLTAARRRAAWRFTAGIGPVAPAAEQTHRVIRHAMTAAQWADLMGHPDSDIVRYEDIAHLRLLPTTALTMSGPLNTLLQSFGALVRYDLDNGADLALTLDALLANNGSVAKTSAQLFIHRNTLRQRIQRIEELIGQSPEDFQDAVAAGLAVRLLRESEQELSHQPPMRTRVRCPHAVLTVGRACCGLPQACPLTAG